VDAVASEGNVGHNPAVAQVVHARSDTVARRRRATSLVRRTVRRP
jgi:hypothetical protein